jgi:hypothetical protein
MSLNPSKNTDPTADNQATIEGAILSASQTRWVKIAIGIMTALLAFGIPVLIGRVIYLARYGANPAVTSVQPALEPSLAATTRLALPPGAQIKTLTLSGSRLAVHHASDGGREEILILDLTTGTVISRVELTRGR